MSRIVFKIVSAFLMLASLLLLFLSILALNPLKAFQAALISFTILGVFCALCINVSWSALSKERYNLFVVAALLVAILFLIYILLGSFSFA